MRGIGRSSYAKQRLGRVDHRPDLLSKGQLGGIEVEGVFKGYPLDELESAGGVVNDSVAGRPIVVFYDSDAQTGVAYLREIDGQTMEFYNVGKDKYEVRDRQTDSL